MDRLVTAAFLIDHSLSMHFFFPFQTTYTDKGEKVSKITAICVMFSFCTGGLKFSVIFKAHQSLVLWVLWTESLMDKAKDKDEQLFVTNLTFKLHLLII